jgi:glycosyltransferase involved in cell wall biosynthesis
MNNGRQPLVSVVVPTRDRPLLLQEALASVAEQTLNDWELIIVDDGSKVPIGAAALAPVRGRCVRVIRHEVARGVAAARQSGFVAAKGQLIAQLDDDDRLAPEALAVGADALLGGAGADVAFIDVQAFGREASAVNERQSVAKARVISLAMPAAGQQGGMIRFDAGLYPALLRSVPVAFQKPMFKRSVIATMTPMSSDHWPESAWAIEAAARDLPCVLVDRPLYLWRRDGQSFFSQAALAHAMRDQHVEMKRRLLGRLRGRLPSDRAAALAGSLGEAVFDRCLDAPLIAAQFWRDFALSLWLAPRRGHLRLLVRRLMQLASGSK